MYVCHKAEGQATRRTMTNREMPDKGHETGMKWSCFRLVAGGGSNGFCFTVVPSVCLHVLVWNVRLVPPGGDMDREHTQGTPKAGGQSSR